MMIVYFLCFTFCQLTFPHVLIVSQEVMHAVGRVRLQEKNKKQQRNPAALETHHHHIHRSKSTATYSRRLATK